jgi:hypothetical protein
MILLIFMLVLLVGGLVHKGAVSVVRHSLGLGGEKGQATSNTVNDTTGIDEQMRLWTAVDDLQLDRLLKASAS